MVPEDTGLVQMGTTQLVLPTLTTEAARGSMSHRVVAWFLALSMVLQSVKPGSTVPCFLFRRRIGYLWRAM
jgi:hypothetical protein